MNGWILSLRKISYFHGIFRKILKNTNFYVRQKLYSNHQYIFNKTNAIKYWLKKNPIIEFPQTVWKKLVDKHKKELFEFIIFFHLKWVRNLEWFKLQKHFSSHEIFSDLITMYTDNKRFTNTHNIMEKTFIFTLTTKNT